MTGVPVPTRPNIGEVEHPPPGLNYIPTYPGFDAVVLHQMSWTARSSSELSLPPSPLPTTLSSWCGRGMTLKLPVLLLLGIFCNADGFQSSCCAAGSRRSRGSAFRPTRGLEIERSRCLTPPPAIPMANAKPRSRSVARVNARMSHNSQHTGGYLRSFRGLVAHLRQNHRSRSVPAVAAAAAGRQRAGPTPQLPSVREGER